MTQILIQFFMLVNAPRINDALIRLLKSLSLPLHFQRFVAGSTESNLRQIMYIRSSSGVIRAEKKNQRIDTSSNQNNTMYYEGQV